MRISLKLIIQAARFAYNSYVLSLDSKTYGCFGKNVILHPPMINTNPQNVFLYENVNIFENATLIIDSKGKFIMKRNSGSAQGLTVITANHTTTPTIGKWHKTVITDTSTDKSSDVVVEEDVWLAANVTLLPGVVVGRGAIVGAGSVCRSSVPPYSIVIGNPAKVIGFKFTPEEVIQHEIELYSIEQRLPIRLLEKNYKRYYLDRLKEISSFVKR